MPFILGANSVSGYTVKNSLRFNSGSSDNLSKTFSVAQTSTQKMTFSFWFKRSVLGTDTKLLESYNGSNAGFSIKINTDNTVYANITSGGVSNGQINTTQVFRDVSAWYHLIVAIDTTLATAGDRMRMYLNGSEITTFSTDTNPTQNVAVVWANNSVTNYICANYNGTSEYFNGYMSEFYFIDGQQLTPSSFGETDDSGIWKPKAYTGTYGTNGFYLKFGSSSALGTDSSGNGNNFTVNNLTSVDQTTDTPTNNFCTLNPLDNGNSNILTSNGNNSVSSSTTWDRGIKATFGISSGKWYWEYKHGTVNSGTNPAGDLGITKYSSLINSGSNGGATNSESYFIGGADGSKYNGSYTPTSYGSAFTTGDIAMLALDMDNGKFYMGKNGTWFNSGNPATSTNPAFTSLSGTFFPVWYWGISAGTSGVLISDFNFGNPPYSANSYADANGFGNFSYSVPSGYYSLCTKNLYQYGF